jgi:hypothetical protein
MIVKPRTGIGSLNASFYLIKYARKAEEWNLLCYLYSLTDSSDGDSSNVTIIIGAVVGVCVLILVILAIIMFRR